MADPTSAHEAESYAAALLVGQRTRLRELQESHLPVLERWQHVDTATLQRDAVVRSRPDRRSTSSAGGAPTTPRAPVSAPASSTPPTSSFHAGCWYDEVLMSVLDHEWVARDS